MSGDPLPVTDQPLQDELDPLARVWFDAWNDAHAQIVSPELKRLRTFESFQSKTSGGPSRHPGRGSPGFPVGFYILKGDELYQLFVAAGARGTGVAAALIDDAEARLSAKGIQTAWLACAIGNHRAARFYEKRGWHRVGTMVNEAETSEGIFRLDVWRYEKTLTR